MTKINIRTLCSAVTIACLLATSSAFGAATVVHVPGDQSSLQVALDTVPDGGVVELAAGTYSAPGPSGFTIFPDQSGGTRSFTVRAAAGASVVLTGNSTSRILTLTTPKPVFFERITFTNGLSTEQYHGGALSLAQTQASFTSCTFDKNAANPSSTGGGAVWIDTSTVSFQGCIFTNNTSLNYAGAISALLSRVFISDSRFVGNRVNLPGQSDFNAGGAIHANGGTMKIAHCRFDDNQAGYVGGAIYVIGLWQDPGMDLTVSDSEFSNNVAALGPTGTKPDPTTGGALFLEAQTTAHIFNCRFTNNSAQQGGAISIFQAITEVKNCVFTNNRATGSGFSESLGGAIVALSADAPSQPNRRPSQLTVTDSLIQGPGASAPSARQGGGIFIAGDLNFAYGLGGAPIDGTVDSNRAVAYLTRVVFSNLATVGPDNNGGSGGALTSDFATVHMHDCIVQNCSTSHFGGALELVRRSVGDIHNTTFIGNTAGQLGGAITMFGGELNVDASNFLENGLNTANAEGTVLVTSADPGDRRDPPGFLPPVDMVGTISNCLIQNNTGKTTLYDGDSTTAPFNRLQYKGNRIYPNLSNMYRDDVGGAPGNVQQLNAISIPRSDGSVTDKAPLDDNVAPTGPERVGAILMVPPTVLQNGAPGETMPTPSFLAYAASGDTAILDGTPQRNNADVTPTSTDGVHTLNVGTLTFSTAPPPGAALNISTRLPVGTGQSVLIGGFIIQGPVSKRVMIRSVGPSLNASVSNALQDPTLELHDSKSALIGKNDNWRTTQLGGLITSDQSIEILATSIAPASDAESAIIATLPPGGYTAVVGGANNSTGIGLVEVYDLDAVQDSTLANISTRGFIQGGDNVMIGGFIYLGGVGATKVVVRGIGPSLTPLGINNALTDPVLEVHDSNGNPILSNDNWQQSPDAATIQAAGLAPSNPAESALLLTGLARGNYTAVLKGQNSGTGVGVIEAYIFP